MRFAQTPQEASRVRVPRDCHLRPTSRRVTFAVAHQDTLLQAPLRRHLASTSMNAALKLTIATRMQFVRTHLAVSSAPANRASLVLEQQAVKMSMNAALGHTTAT